MATISVSTAAQKNEFTARLARIDAGTGSSKTTLYVGVEGTVLASSKNNAKLRKQAIAVPARPLGLFGVAGSALFGAVALGMALYLRFAITGQAGPLDNTDLTMAINGGAALAIALFCGSLVKMPMVKYTAAAILGVVAGLVGYHNLVHVYPGQFATMFSPVWVEQVVTATPAHSIIWRGQTFVL
jgi:hypothetical protein